MTNKTLEGMARAYEGAWDLLGVELEPSDRMRAALEWLADQIEENGDAVKHCKLAAVSAYLAKGQEGRGVVEPARLMKAISAALRAAEEEATP